MNRRRPRRFQSSPSRSGRRLVLPGGLILVVLVVIVALALQGGGGGGGGGAKKRGISRIDAVIRVNLLGYLGNGPKQAILLSNRSLGKAEFSVVGGHGVFLRGSIGRKRPSGWNSRFPFAYALDFSRFKRTGRYVLELNSTPHSRSPSFRVGAASSLYGPALARALFFFRAQHDGNQVDAAVLGRRPAHLLDRQAAVYHPPEYSAAGVLQGGLRPTTGHHNVLGGWFDAGDYLKFVETASYAEALILIADRDFPALMRSRAHNFMAEGRYEISWLLKMWDDHTRTLYYQVGIGDGNARLRGDHDLWRLPQADDALHAPRGNPRYYVKHRPVFRAGPAGARISPNLAGRLAADFGLCYQIFHRSAPVLATRCLMAGEHVFDLARTRDVRRLLTTSPHSYYPETSWQDDLELGAA
ncbi:MAG TPA: glycoside hydrolase family 9 protein, partial [Chloroflexota bacterium]|nr:glycoside hydrolase family 9 protein [Chloroflexota bacterium]